MRRALFPSDRGEKWKLSCLSKDIIIALIEAWLEGRIIKCLVLFCPAFGLSHPLNHEDNPVVEGEKAVSKQEPEVASKVCHKVIAVISQILK